MIEINKWEKEQNDLALLDEEFLSELYEQEYHEKYARITSLTFDELPIAQIEGKTTSGTINVDGNSNVRRTFNLTLTAHNVDINDYYWGIKTKVKLEIGLKNNIKNKEKYSKYPEIIWFNQGMYIISTFNTSVATNGYTINISGKDKMCLLNGDLGGQLFASIDFGAEEQIKKFFKKAVITDTSLDTIMAGHYYFIPDLEDYPDVVSTNDDLYEFQLVNIPVPFYIKEGSNFRLVKDENIDIGNLQRYRLFKRVISPNDILIELPQEAPTDGIDSYTPLPSEPEEPTVTEPADNNDSLVDTPTPSKPVEEPYVEEEIFQKPPKVKRVTGLYPIQGVVSQVDDPDQESHSAEDFVFDYNMSNINASGVERYIGETWKYRRGEVDYNYPPGGWMSKQAYLDRKAKENGGES